MNFPRKEAETRWECTCAVSASRGVFDLRYGVEGKEQGRDGDGRQREVQAEMFHTRFSISGSGHRADFPVESAHDSIGTPYRAR